MLMSDSTEAHLRICEAPRPVSLASSSASHPSLSITHFRTAGLILIELAVSMWRGLPRPCI